MDLLQRLMLNDHLSHSIVKLHNRADFRKSNDQTFVIIHITIRCHFIIARS